MSGFHDLSDLWARDAETMLEYGDERGSLILQRCASQLLEAVRAHRRELLTPAEASSVSGFSRRTLRGLVASGKLENRGAKGSPKYRRSDLPSKARPADVFDASAAARGLLT